MLVGEVGPMSRTRSPVSPFSDFCSAAQPLEWRATRGPDRTVGLLLPVSPCDF